MNFLRKSFFIVGLFLAVTSLSQSLNAVRMCFTTIGVPPIEISCTPSAIIKELEQYVFRRVAKYGVTRILNLVCAEGTFRDTDSLEGINGVVLNDNGDITTYLHFTYVALYENSQ